ncbi:acylneuraminate cytidylyltransferase [Domibacillus antri]|uniref:Acylneuraminate cytidylyltransferase n=1 Tax=Domibacillus antri TaxID=1714264 RepID=A0A1Q8Q9L1_9BACI|nr:glycosyltransferase family protein [Domibacillus antri]OLN24030.1 acylneuraminate cytidylyltransferase [Domibacillus antri]
MNTTAIIQARMGSTRLPGKILKQVNGKTLLEYQTERVKQSNEIDQIIIATTVKESDEPIVDFCDAHGIACYRGSEEDVLSRYYEAAQQFEADIIVRLTSDCPIIDPAVMDRVVRYYKDHQPQYDYVSNTIERTYPRGMDTEVFSYEVLKTAYEQAVFPRDREHVTAYLYTNPEQFRIGRVKQNQDYSNYRWTVDTVEDFELIKLILNELYQPDRLFSLTDVIALLEKYPQWNQINEHIEQKKL